MALVKWEPFRELTEMRQQMDRLFDNFFRREGMPALTVEGAWAPAVDVTETADEILVKADYKKGVLAIRLPKKEEVKPKEIPINITK